MTKKTMIGALLVVGALALPLAARAQDTQKPVTAKTVTKNTGKAVAKGAKDTGKQAKRTARGVKKVYSRKARQEANGEKARKDSVKAATNP
jgi:ribosome recycling factor